ncbi:MAG: peptidase [Micavibrio sp.]|nr:peptidase [Micavibrio sp.]
MIRPMTQTAKKEKIMKQAEKIAALRDVLKAQKVDGFLVPRADEYQNEYVPERAERLLWLTGFTGSAGNAVVLADKAMVQSDSRYELQIEKQVDAAIYTTTMNTDVSLGAWIAGNAKSGQVIGYDPKVHTPGQIRALDADLKGSGIILKALSFNPLDSVWADQPSPPMGKIEIFPDYIAGRSARDKREEIAAKVVKEGAVATVLTLPDSIAWLLNIRGTDVPHTPLPLSQAIVGADGMVTLFIYGQKVPEDVHAHLGNHVTLAEPGTLEDALKTLGTQSKAAGKPVLFDEARSSIWARQCIEAGGGTTRNAEDLCILPKACKTPEEQDGIRNAHFRDGVAVTKFLAWLDREGTTQTLTELDIADRLEDFRRVDPTYRDSSFDTISGWNANGAIVHYRATEADHATIEPPGMLLLDSGGQYANGTTDITRTIAIGKPTAEIKTAFTLVLKGHIGIADLTFPEGTKGADIDIVARMAMWKHKFNYGHGTGHGVGCYLSVHEEGGGISSRAMRPYKPGMVISNEPGYYKTGAFGIRIENLVLVREAGLMEDGKKALVFETLTVVPFDKTLIDAKMLNADEIRWLNDYHARVAKLLMPYMSPDEQAWLQEATSPLKKTRAAGPASKQSPRLSPTKSSPKIPSP